MAQQGSVLGPLLFLLYINDFNKALSTLDLHLFADDANLFFLIQVCKYFKQQSTLSYEKFMNGSVLIAYLLIQIKPIMS